MTQATNHAAAVGPAAQRPTAPAGAAGGAPAAGRRPCPAAPAHPKTLQPTNPFTKVDAHLLQDGIPVRATQHARPDDHRRPLRALQPV